MYRIDKDKIFWRKVEGETVILNIDTGFYYTLDQTGSDIWEMILKNMDSEEIASKIVDEYETVSRTAKRDINVLLKRLEKEDIINRS